MTGLLLLLASSVSWGGELDLTLTSSTGCGPEWATDCLPNLVWGSNDVLGVHTPGTVPVLTVGASATSTTKVSLGTENAGSQNFVFIEMDGKSLSPNTNISVETEFLDSTGKLIGGVTIPILSQDEGMFAVWAIDYAMPVDTDTYRSRLVVDGGAALFSKIVLHGTEGGIPHEDIPGSEDCETCWDTSCVDENGNGYTQKGLDCGAGCIAPCSGVFDADYAAHPLVVLSP